jgi:hypothetical protein
MDNSNVRRLKELRAKSFALDEFLDKIGNFNEKALKLGKISKANEIIDSLILETKDTKEGLFNLLVKDQQGEDYEVAKQALVLFNFTIKIESKIYSLRDRKGI